MSALVLIRGGGDLASGVALRLNHCGLRVILTELPQPLMVRRLACFGEAVYRGQFTVEGVSARLVKDPTDTLSVLMTLSKGLIPILIDPEGAAVSALHPTAVVDARMLKQPVELDPRPVPLLVGLGPGFEAGVNCHAVIETRRGPFLGRVLWQGQPQTDTGIPDEFHAPGTASSYASSRVLRAPLDGIFDTQVDIGAQVKEGELLGAVAGAPLYAPFDGLVRGLLHPGLPVQQGMKVGDVDPRSFAKTDQVCERVSDKALAVGGGVLEALLTKPELRRRWWD